jgi:hypothetical protein
MKKAILLLCAVSCLMLVGCEKIWGPVAETDALLKERDDTMSEILKKLEANPDEAGVDAARKVFESHKANLEAKYKAVNDAPPAMNADWMKKLFDSDSSDGKIWLAMRVKFGTDCKSGCDAAEKNLTALGDDYRKAAGESH